MGNESVWDDSRLMKRLLELSTERDMTGSPSESQMADILAEEFGVELTRNAVHGKLTRERLAAIEPAPCVFMPYYEKYRSLIENPLIDGGPKIDLSGRKKILHLSDLHVPFQNRAALKEAFNRHAAADILVLSEIMDVSSQSTFNKLGAVSLQQEVEETLILLEFISKNFPQTLILESNHEFRVKRVLSKALPLELQMMVQEWNILELLARPFHNIATVPNWWMQLGDALICHATKSSYVSLKAAVELDVWFRTHAHDLGIEPHRVLIQAHTHTLGATYGPGFKLFESGMMGQIRDWYLAKPHKTTWATGYITLEMQDGVCILDKCREHFVESDLESTKFFVVKKVFCYEG